MEKENIASAEPARVENRPIVKGDEMSLGKKLCTFVTLYLALFVAYGLYSLPASFLPLYHMDRGISQAITGLIISAVPFCYIFMCPVAARMIDKGSIKRFLLINSGLLAILTFMFCGLGHIRNNKLYIASSMTLRIGQGLCGGFIDMVVFVSTGRMFPNNLALVTAVLETSVNGAIAASPYIGALLYENLNFTMAFVVPGCAMILIFLVSMFTVADVDCKQDAGGSHGKSVVTDWLIMFPAIHCAFSQTLICFVVPIMAPYTQEQFGRGSVFAGLCLLINLAGVIAASPVLGYLMDKFDPIMFFVFAGVANPIAYLFLGPVSFLQSYISPTTIQLLIVLTVLGFIKPAACNPSRLIMLDLYKTKHGHVPQSVQNLITSLYCGSFSFGAWFGVFISGIIADYMTFADSTSMMGFIAMGESIILFLFCYYAKRLKSGKKNENAYKQIDTIQ